MSDEGFSADPGFGGVSGFGGPDFSNVPGFGGGPGFGGPGHAGFGPGAVGHGPAAGFKRAAFGTAVILLEGPASATQILERVNEATGGALNPPEHIVELAIGLLAARGFVSIDDGVATPTELGRSVLAWRGVTSESAAVFLKQAARFAEVFKLRTELFEVAGLARSIAWSGTEEQKATLSQVRIKVLDAVSEAKKELHLVLAES